MGSLSFFAACPRAFEDLVAAELVRLGAADVRESVAGVYFRFDLAGAYRFCLGSRIASRVFHPIASFAASSAEELRDAARLIPWEEHFGVDESFAVECTLVASELRHSDYAALLVKDGIADRFRERTGGRPNVDARNPDIRVNLHVERGRATVSVDIGGGSLHRRSYRVHGVAAPMKENVAAGILTRAGWQEIAAGGGALIDPMCGSGTILIEGALIALDHAPGLLWADARRPPQKWRGNDIPAWTAAVAEARDRAQAGRAPLPVMRGFDLDPKAIDAARQNIAKAGLSSFVEVEQRELAAVRPPESTTFGLVATNPPYGERISGGPDSHDIFERIGRLLHDHFRGWRAAVLAGDLEHSKRIGLRAAKVNTVYNGPIRCSLAHFELSEDNRFVPAAREAPAARSTARSRGAAMPAARSAANLHGAASGVAGTAPSPSGSAVKAGRGERAAAGTKSVARTHRTSTGILTFVNRIIKNRKMLGSWASDNGITCYRLYDADLPEYAVAVDLYEGRWLHVQEYVAPAVIDPDKASRRLDDIVTVLPEALSIPSEHLFLKRRKKRRRTEQYTRLETSGEFYEIHEGGHTFLANFTDYLDTGIFLDHRLIRGMIRDEAKGARFLNLYSYTATASVYAVAGGARSTLSVDGSNTYQRWARENFVANRIAGQQHRLERADCWEWLHTDRGIYDLIYMDPPTFSNAKGKRATLDVQRDHVKLIRLVMERLAPEGVLLFSTNFRRFKMDEAALLGMEIEDISRKTIPRDFERNPHIHHAFRIHRAKGASRGTPESAGLRSPVGRD